MRSPAGVVDNHNTTREEPSDLQKSKVFSFEVSLIEISRTRREALDESWSPQMQNSYTDRIRLSQNTLNSRTEGKRREKY